MAPPWQTILTSATGTWGILIGPGGDSICKTDFCLQPCSIVGTPQSFAVLSILCSSAAPMLVTMRWPVLLDFDQVAQQSCHLTRIMQDLHTLYAQMNRILSTFVQACTIP
eukprot:3016275-Amphidinium_carterae.1